MDIDYNSILRDLVEPPKQREAQVTEEILANKANCMAMRGYIHSYTSLTALECYLRGYGLLLSGPVGVGKTLFFRKVEPDGGVPILPFNSCCLWRYETLEAWLRETANGDIVIDDLGWEMTHGDKGMARNFGQIYDTLQIVLDFRLRCTSRRTHITTNLDNDGLLRLYDYHLVDRIYGMCKAFVWDAQTSSKRIAKPNRVAVIEYENERRKA